MSTFASTYDLLLPVTPFSMGVVMAIIMTIMIIGIMTLNISAVGTEVCIG